MTLISFIAGCFVGALIGIFIMCLCRISAGADRLQEECLKLKKAAGIDEK